MNWVPRPMCELSLASARLALIQNQIARKQLDRLTLDTKEYEKYIRELESIKETHKSVVETLYKQCPPLN